MLPFILALLNLQLFSLHPAVSSFFFFFTRLNKGCHQLVCIISYVDLDYIWIGLSIQKRSFFIFCTWHHGLSSSFYCCTRLPDFSNTAYSFQDYFRCDYINSIRVLWGAFCVTSLLFCIFHLIHICIFHWMSLLLTAFISSSFLMITQFVMQ